MAEQASGTESQIEPAVTVCMPVSGRPELFAQALRSAVEQTLREPLEVVVIDDSGGSLRDTVDAVGDDRVVYSANPERLGFAGNHAAALHAARGDLVAFLHQDDLHEPTFLERAAEVFRAHPEVGILFADCWVDRDGSRRRRGVQIPEGRIADPLERVVRHDYWLPSSTVVRRLALADVRPLPDVAVADLHLYIDVVANGWDAWWIGEPLVVYREHPAQLSTDDAAMRRGQVHVFDAYRFDDPRAERARRGRLAWALVSLGGLDVRGGRRPSGRAALRRAKVEAPDVMPSKRRALTAISFLPLPLTGVHRLWTALRRASGVERRHQYRH